MVDATTLPTPEIYGPLIELDRTLKKAKANLHDRATVLIEACILNGIDSGSLIVHVLARLNFDRRHVGIMLDQQAGPTPASGRWFRDTEGRYELHEPVKT